MKRIFCTLLLVLAGFSALHAQDIDLDKSTGLVQVDGRDAFYLKATNKRLGRKDFVLTNPAGEELAYIKCSTRQTDRWDAVLNTYVNELYYGMTFSRSGNYCELAGIDVLMAMKMLARQIVSARLIKDGEISADDEQKFVVMHGGTFLKDPNAGPAVVFNQVMPPQGGNGVPERTADIAISGDRIYNSDQLLGTFKSEDVQAMKSITVYSPSDLVIVRAWRRADGTGDWEVTAGTRKMTIRYHADAPLQKLFSRLVENGLIN